VEKPFHVLLKGFMLVDIALHCLMTEEIFGTGHTKDEVERDETPIQ
jgi:hypothetical protein